MSLGKKKRFDVFKRDSFTCAYCGATPPAVVLEVDHIKPKSKGGLDDIDNLITACFDCNRGKRDGLLTDIPESLEKKKEAIQEAQSQLQEYEKMLKAKRRKEDAKIKKIQDAMQQFYPDRSFTTKFKNSIRTQFLFFLHEIELIDAIESACERTKTVNDATKYFCGICWNIRRSKSDG